MSKSVLHTSLCDDLKIEYPFFLAGMGVKGKATPPELVAAVSEAGGMGILGSWAGRRFAGCAHVSENGYQ